MNIGEIFNRTGRRPMPLCYSATADDVEIWLHGEVGDAGTLADSLSIGKVLREHRSKPVTLRVNSPGGLAYDGVAIYNALRDHNAPTVGIIEGLAGSAASVAVVGCDQVRIHRNAVFHPHYCLIAVYGHQAEIRDAIATMELLDQSLEDIYMRASGRSRKQVQKDLNGPHGDGTRFSAADAVKAGYVHEIIGKRNSRKASTAKLDGKAKIAAYERQLAALTAGLN